ncbi:MAG: translation initiation factor eIF-2B [Nitrososphaerota archaeon]|nr:translation initiation factor eIF-2B [Aigarchaeota archaeon]MDW8076435.1 translation initiation factor eIF-2B [Nitrososphaerota archaeon]
MERGPESILKEIRNDVERGAAELTIRAMDAFIVLADSPHSRSAEELKRSVVMLARQIAESRPSMFSLRNAAFEVAFKFMEASRYVDNPYVLKELLKQIALSIFDEHKVAVERLRRFGRELLSGFSSVVTLSYSSSVLAILKEVGKSIKVYVAESRPLFEGRKMAAALAEAGIETVLTTDAAISYMLKGADAALVGADSIFVDGSFANKVGTFQLACASKFLGKPFYVVSTTWKALPTLEYPEEEHAAEEVMPPELSSTQKIKIRNPYFEVVPAELVTAYITEEGVLKPSQIVELIEARLKKYKEMEEAIYG